MNEEQAIRAKSMELAIAYAVFMQGNVKYAESSFEIEEKRWKAIKLLAKKMETFILAS